MRPELHQAEQTETHGRIRFAAIASQNLQGSCEVRVNLGFVPTFVRFEDFSFQFICTHYVTKGEKENS